MEPCGLRKPLINRAVPHNVPWHFIGLLPHVRDTSGIQDMARRQRNNSLETRTARLKLAVRRRPYPGAKLSRGKQMQYRRNKGNGTWSLKVSDGHGKPWTKAFAQADDFDESDNKTILTFFEAQDVAKGL